MTAGETRPALRKQRVGRVVSDAMDKTIIVMLETRRPHPDYGKMVRHVKRLYAHDEKNEAKTGDTVRIEETRPLSRLKRWRLIKIMERGEVSPEESEQ